MTVESTVNENHSETCEISLKKIIICQFNYHQWNMYSKELNVQKENYFLSGVYPNFDFFKLTIFEKLHLSFKYVEKEN